MSPKDGPHAHGGQLVCLLASPERARALREAAGEGIDCELTPRQLADLELLLNGGFSPLRGFLTRVDYETVCRGMRLANGTLWPIPVVLDVPRELADRLSAGSSLSLRDPDGAVLATMRVGDMWEPDRREEAAAVFGTEDPSHPGVAHFLRTTRPVYLGGEVEGIEAPRHYDSPDLRLPPAALRIEFARLGWARVVAFQTRNPLHRAHFELTLRAVRESGASLLIHPAVGPALPGDLDHYTRVRCYRAVLPRYSTLPVKLALLPLAMRLAGPREALWHAIIRRNYGCTHLIVGRDHAGPGKDTSGQPFYAPRAALDLVQAHEDELGLRAVGCDDLLFVAELDAYMTEGEIPPGRRGLHLSGTELRRLLREGQPLPSWFTFPEMAAELEQSHPPRHRQGFTVFLTGLSGAGKSSVARALLARLREMGPRPVTLLDGDASRRRLSSELGFSREHRDLHVRRMGFVAAEITRHGGIAICAPIAPYDATRKEVRRMVDPLGGFFLVWAHASLSVCEQRDPKGLYARARAGLLPCFTGVSDPYEPPDDAEVVLETADLDPQEAATRILSALAERGYVRSQTPFTRS